MRRVLVICLVALAISVSAQTGKSGAPAQPGKGVSSATVKDGVFHSDSLGRDMKYRILFPRSYESDAGRFPVLYLLHGLHGDYLNWDTLTDLEHYAENLTLIVVMPDADDSWYTNSATDPRDRFEDYVARDLIAEIDVRYRTIRSQSARAVAGLSMGGYAAIKLALKYPDSFIVAGSLSGALNAGGDLDKREQEYRERLLQVFGPEGSVTRKDNDLFQLLERGSPAQLPYLYLACGTDDKFVTTNRQFVQELSARKIAYEYHETPGAHAWDYWDRALRAMLPVIAGKLSLQAVPAP